MKDLGQKTKDLYDSPTSPENKNKIVYPEINFPLSLVEGMDLKKDDEVDIHIKGKMCGFEDTKWSQRVTFEAHKGEVKKAGKSKKSILEQA